MIITELCISQFQLRPAPSGPLWGICPHCQSGEWGICKSCAARGPGICQPLPFDTHAVSYQNITTQRTLLEKQADWFICKGREKIEKVCNIKACSRFMHVFFHCLSSQNYIVKLGSYRRESMFFWLLNQVSLDTI